MIFSSHATPSPQRRLGSRSPQQTRKRDASLRWHDGLEYDRFEKVMDINQSRKLDRIIYADQLRIGLPIIVSGILGLAILYWASSHIFVPTRPVSCRYQYFVISQSKLSPGVAFVTCKLIDGRLALTTRTAPWTPPPVDSEMQIEVPK